MPPPPRSAEWRIADTEPRQLATRPDVLIAELAAEQWGVVNTEELLRCGLSDQGITTRVRNARLHRLHRGVYAVGHANPPPAGRFLAAVKAAGAGALLSHRSAAAHWGLTDDDGGRIDVSVPTAGGRRVPGLVIHRCRIEPEDRRRRDGVPLTSPERTIIDLAGVVSPRGLRRAVREAQAQRLISLPGLLRVMERAGPRRGVVALRRIVAAGPAPTRSELEDVVLELMLRAGFAAPAVNQPLVVAGRTVIPDFRWPAERLIVEADGAAWHDHKLAREDDAERQALLEAHGDGSSASRGTRRSGVPRRRSAASTPPASREWRFDDDRSRQFVTRLGFGRVVGGRR